MPSELEKLQALGSPREGDDATSEQARKSALAWVKKYKTTYPDEKEDKTGKTLVGHYNTLAKSGKLGEWAGQVSGIGATLMAKSVGYLASKAKKAYTNVVEIGRRRRKYGLVAGGAVVGAGVGALLGTFVLPGLGTLIGGTVGAAVTSGVATLGGVLGTALITAGAGAYAGNAAGRRLEDSETAYKFKPSIQTDLKKKASLSDEDSKNLYAYLRNRQDHVKDDDVKKALKLLKNGIFKKGNLQGLNSLTFYLTQELSELSKIKDPDPAQKNDIEFIKKILGQLQKSNVLKKESKKEIESALKEAPAVKPADVEPAPAVKEASSPRKAPVLHAQKLPRYPGLIATSDHASPVLVHKQTEYTEQLKQKFKDTIPHLQTVNMEASQVPAKHKHIRRYQLERQNAPSIDFSIQEKAVEEGVKTKFILSEKVEDKEMASEVLAASAKLYLDTLEAKETQLYVVANGNQDWALRLLVQAYKQGLSPKLDKNEFPEKEVRHRLNREARDAAHVPPLDVGFRFGKKNNN